MKNLCNRMKNGIGTIFVENIYFNFNIFTRSFQKLLRQNQCIEKDYSDCCHCLSSQAASLSWQYFSAWNTADAEINLKKDMAIEH